MPQQGLSNHIKNSKERQKVGTFCVIPPVFSLQQALACLNADQRRVIALRYGADLTETEIAQALGWPIGTVKSRLSRAREHLRVLLEEGKR